VLPVRGFVVAARGAGWGRPWPEGCGASWLVAAHSATGTPPPRKQGGRPVDLRDGTGFGQKTSFLVSPPRVGHRRFGLGIKGEWGFSCRR